MVVRGATKRKRLDPKKQLKGDLIAVVSNSRGRKKVAEGGEVEAGEDEEDEDEEGEDDNNDDDYEESHSQKRRMMLFEKKLKEIKKQKKSTSENGTIKFKKKVKLQEEALISSLQAQRAKIKANASGFSKVLTTLLHNASDSSFSRLMAESTIISPELVQNCQLHVSRASITALSTKLLASSQSLQSALTAITDREFVLGEGWERDGDLSISVIRQAQQSALVKLTGMISKDRNENAAGAKEEAEAVAWKHTAKISMKGISSLLKHLPVPTTDEESGALDKMRGRYTNSISS